MAILAQIRATVQGPAAELLLELAEAFVESFLQLTSSLVPIFHPSFPSLGIDPENALINCLHAISISECASWDTYSMAPHDGEVLGKQTIQPEF